MKKDTLASASKKALATAFKCGECLHFKAHAHVSRQQVCSKEGVKAFAVAPKCYTPDVTQVATNSDQLVALSGLFDAYSTKQRRIIIAMLKARPTSKKKLTFGTKVYFKGFGNDYISNYLAGYVMGYTSSGEIIISGSPEHKSRGKSYTAYMKDDEGLLTLEEWKVKRRKLKEAGKVQDPNVKFKPKGAIDDWEPPTIDSAPAAWHDKKEQQVKRRNAELTFTVI